jgi:deoxyribose-phosphate aldolase
MESVDWKYIAEHIDHTLLKPTSTTQDIISLCNEGIEMKVYSVCIPPTYIRLAKDVVGSSLKVDCVVSFPLGYNLSEVKVYEVQKCINEGADEVDFVINQGFVKEGRWEEFDKEVSLIVGVSSGHGVLTKAIIEACNLSDQEKIDITERLNILGVDFVKTSTGFSTSGATLQDVRLLKSHCKGKMKVKAAGGIRTLDQVMDFLKAGADRIGTSSTKSIREEYMKKS